MDGFDFSPLLRSTIGFDRLTRLMDAATQVDSGGQLARFNKRFQGIGLKK